MLDRYNLGSNTCLMKGVHRFSAVQRDLRDRFARIVETADDWIEIERIGEGESESWRVRNPADNMVGVAKPGPPHASQDDQFRAAHEKIAFDLSHLIGLPVCPVVLWPKDIQTTYRVGRSISCWAFPQGDKWNVADGKGLISAAQKQSVAGDVAAMRVFHAWIGDTDRKPDHVFIDTDSPPDHLNIAFFDHGHSMSHAWKGDNANCGVCGHYLDGVPEDRETMIAVAEHIATMADGEIQGLVDRIPTQYLPTKPRGHIIQNLLARKGNLRRLIGI
jgi:hypothetical protein